MPGISFNCMSKSVGNGRVVFVGSGVEVSGVVLSVGRGRCSYALIRLRARINTLCNSGGRSTGNSGFFSVGSLGVVVSFAVGGVGSCFVSDGNFMFGFGIVIKGFLLRIINVVVAIYNGSAARISNPNTKPAKPCNSARASLCHCVALKRLKLNIKYSTVHMIAV